MGLTQRHQLPFPEPSDDPDIPRDLYELANRLDEILTALAMQLNARLDELEQRIDAAVVVPSEWTE